MTTATIEKKKGTNIVKYHPDAFLDHPFQMRKNYGSKKEWAEFKRNLLEAGQLEPVNYVTDKDGNPVLTSGHRRVRAINELIAEGKGTDKFEWVNSLCEGRNLSDSEIICRIMDHNVSKGLEPIEEAHGYQHLLDSGMKQKNIAERRGIDAATVSTRLKLLRSGSDELLEAVNENEITEHAAQQIITAEPDDKEAQDALLAKEKESATGKKGRRNKGTTDELKSKVNKKKKKFVSKIKSLSKSELQEQVTIFESRGEDIMTEAGWNVGQLEGVNIGLAIALGRHPAALPSGQLEESVSKRAAKVKKDDEKQAEVVAKIEVEKQAKRDAAQQKKEAEKEAKKAKKQAAKETGGMVDKTAPKRLVKLVKRGKVPELSDPGMVKAVPPVVVRGLSNGESFSIGLNEKNHIVWNSLGKQGEEATITLAETPTE